MKCDDGERRERIPAKRTGGWCKPVGRLFRPEGGLCVSLPSRCQKRRRGRPSNCTRAAALRPRACWSPDFLGGLRAAWLVPKRDGPFCRLFRRPGHPGSGGGAARAGVSSIFPRREGQTLRNFTIQQSNNPTIQQSKPAKPAKPTKPGRLPQEELPDTERSAGQWKRRFRRLPSASRAFGR